MKLLKNKLADPTILFVAMILVNGGNYCINLALGRILGPEVFAEASVLATIVLMLSFIAVGIQLTSAKFTASEEVGNTGSALIYWMSQNVRRVSFVLAGILILLSPVIASYLNFSSSTPFIIIAIGLPFFFSMAVKRGKMQGVEEFRSLAITYLLEMALRLSVTFGLVLLALTYFNFLTIQAVAIGFLVSFFAAHFYKIETSKKEVSSSQKKSILQFVLIIGLYELSQIIINNSDVILTKHFFTAKEAGLYAAIALIGRVVFFGTWTVVTLLFPKVIQKEKEGLPHRKLFWNALAMVSVFGLAIVTVCFLFPAQIITILFGSEYVSAGSLLWIYALSTSLFACANVFAYYHMSLDNYIPVAITLIAGCLQVILINIFHASMMQVVYVQLYLMTTLLVAMIMYHNIQGIYKTNTPRSTKIELA